MIYIVIAIVAMLAFLAEKTNKKAFLYCVIVVLSLFVGFRSRIVGIDTDMYYLVFSNLVNNIFSPNIEREFLLICRLFLYVLKPEFLFLLFSFVTNTLILLRLWDYKASCSFFLTCMLYVLLFYPETANIMRQYLAVAMVFYSTRYIERKKPSYYFIFLLLATLIHRSALLGICYYPIYYLNDYVPREKKAKIKMTILLGIPIALIVFYVIVEERKYSAFLLSNNSFGVLYPIELFLLFLIWCLSSRGKSFMVEKQVYNVVLRSYLLGIILSAAGYYQTSLYRLGLYFILYRVVYIPLLFRSSRNSIYYKVAYGAFVGFLIINNMISGWSGLALYSTWL